MAWRGPMAGNALGQLIDAHWGDVTDIIVDLPPGTGDVQLTLIQKTPLDGAVIVSTSQEVALADARRGHALFAKAGAQPAGAVCQPGAGGAGAGRRGAGAGGSGGGGGGF